MENVKIVLEKNLTPEQKKAFESVLKESSKNGFLDSDMEELFNSNRCRVILYGDKEEVAGFFTPRSGVYNGKTTWRPGALFTLPKYRGKGIMKEALTQFFRKHARGLCWIDDKNKASIALFTSLGFKRGDAREHENNAGHWYVFEKDKIAMESEVYQEEDGGTFEANGVLYDLNYIFREVAKEPVHEIEVSKLDWVLEYCHSDPERVKKADLDAPILVTKFEGKELVVDGEHRLQKAFKEKKKTMKYRRVSPEIMKKAIVKSSNESITSGGNMKSVRELWQGLMACYKEQGYSSLKAITTLHPPINETEYNALRKTIGEDNHVPEDYLELLKIHNGSGLGKYDLENFSFGIYFFMTSTRAITAMHQLQRALRDGWYGRGKGTPHHVTGVQQVFWDNNWFPILYSEDNEFICIDFNPASGGKVGQVINVDLRRGPTYRWDSFTDFLKKRVELILADPEGEIFLSPEDEKIYAEIEKSKQQGQEGSIGAEKPKKGLLSRIFAREDISTESVAALYPEQEIPSYLKWGK